MVHPGLPLAWAVGLLVAIILVSVWALGAGLRAWVSLPGWSVAAMPGIGVTVRRMASTPWVLLALRFIAVAFFLMVIVAGLLGTPIPERNLATTLTWTLWWSGLILSVYFVGTAWCAVCPWDALAGWLVNQRLWGRAVNAARLHLRVPKRLRNIWPALWMFVALIWLELGLGVTTSPYATAVLALVMLVLAVASLLVYERKAFCRYFCSVGRTVGFYAQMSPVALRPIEPDVCARCTTLECYHGSATVDPCPTHLVMGRLAQNTYCTSCGDCSQSCPHENVAWRVRAPNEEVIHSARAHWDEAWFILTLVGLTSFHGITMMPFWQPWMSALGQALGDSGQLIGSFSIGMFFSMLAPIGLFSASVWLTQYLIQRYRHQRLPYKRVFSALAIATLPLAFAYHLAHNINHLARESRGLLSVMLNPLGQGALPLSEAEQHLRHLQPLIPQVLIFSLQAGLLLFGFWLALRVLRQRLAHLLEGGAGRVSVLMAPVMMTVFLVSVFNLWLLMQPMVVRF